MKKKNQEKRFFFHQMRWVYIVGILVVIGSVMSFGLTMLPIFQATEANADYSVYMLGMIAPMSIVMLLVLRYIVRRTEKKIDPLIEGMQEVTRGNLEVTLPTEGAAEYAPVYEDFNQMVRELRLTKEEMQNFINEFTHEFKTPITSISGFADYLCEAGDAVDPAERQEYLQIISEQAQRLSRLAQNTLLLSKVEACQILTDQEHFSLSGQIQRCALLFLKQLDEKNITLNMPEEEFDFFGNQELLEQVWINLLGNAVKFTPRDGEITLSVQQTPQTLTVCIQDSGCGMSEETLQHIFEKYYQNDALSTAKGNGIGLSIVKRIVELSGGRVTATSQPNQGSTFTVTLPQTE